VFEPTDRHNLLDLLRPPVGYRLDAALGTTFSLDFVALTAVMLAFVDSEPEGATETFNPIETLRAITRLSARVRVFVNRGHIGVDKGAPVNKLCSLLASIVQDVRFDAGYFHPKVWVARYEPRQLRGSESLQPRIRLVCGSRNLTISQYWEAFACFEGVENKVASKCKLANQAAAFVQWLSEGKTTAVLHSLIGGLQRTDFRPSKESLDGYEFHWQRPDGDHLLSEIPKRGVRAVLVSPFVRKTFVARILDRFAQLTLVATQRELDAIDDEEFHQRLKAHDVYVVRAAEGDAGVSAMELHAKLLLCEGDFRAKTIIGSANASESAWRGGNCEAVVSLSPGVPIKNFLKQFLYNDKDDLWGWVERYERKPYQESEEDMAEQQLDCIRDLIAEVELCAKYDPLRERLTLVATGAETEPRIKQINDRVIITACPLSLLEISGSLVSIEGLFAGGLEFRSISVGDLTEFVAFELKHPAIEHPCTLVLRALTDFAHLLADRDAAILKRFLTADKFRDFLDAILFDGARTRRVSTRAPGAGDSGMTGTYFGATIEEVLQSCTEDSSRVAEIDSLLKTFEGTGFVDPLFVQFWDTFRTTLVRPGKN
jgi:hypothetical protein